MWNVNWQVKRAIGMFRHSGFLVSLQLNVLLFESYHLPLFIAVLLFSLALTNIDTLEILLDWLSWLTGAIQTVGPLSDPVFCLVTPKNIFSRLLSTSSVKHLPPHGPSFSVLQGNACGWLWATSIATCSQIAAAALNHRVLPLGLNKGWAWKRGPRTACGIKLRGARL